MSRESPGDEALERLQRDTFGYFLKETNPRNGLVSDNTRQGAPSSITAVGFALAAYVVAVERRFISRAEAMVGRLETTARLAEFSITGVLLAATLSRWVRERAVDAIAGRRTGANTADVVRDRVVAALERRRRPSLPFTRRRRHLW